MQVDNKLLDDLARVAAGAAGAVTGLRDEVEAQMRQRMERILARMDVVTREEFEVVRELAANARRPRRFRNQRMNPVNTSPQMISPVRQMRIRPGQPRILPEWRGNCRATRVSPTEPTALCRSPITAPSRMLT